MAAEQLAPFRDLSKCTAAVERQALERLAAGAAQGATRPGIEYALGIVNAGNQLLARKAADIRRQLEQAEGDVASVERLVRVMVAAFRFLRAHRSSAGFGALALERTLSNAMIACTNAHLGVRVWDGLMLLRSLLLEHAETHVTASGRSGPGAEDPRRPIRRPAPRAKGAADSKPGLADKITRGMNRMSIGKSAAGVGQVRFPIEHCSGDAAFNTLVVTLLCNILRVLAQGPESTEARAAAADLAQRPHSALEWCVRVRKADQDAMDPFLSACFRAYYTLGGHGGSHALDTRLLAIHAYSLTKGCALRELLKYASRAAARAEPPAQAADDSSEAYGAIAAYYARAIELARPQLAVAAASPELVEFCHHAAHVRRHVGDLAGALAACRLGAGTGAAKLAGAILSADVLVQATAASSGHSCAEREHELESICADVGSSAADVLGSGARHTLSEWNALAQCADVARKSAKVVLTALRQDASAAARDGVAGALATVLDAAGMIYETYIGRGAADKAEGGVSKAVLWNHCAEASLAAIQTCLLVQGHSSWLQRMAERNGRRLRALCGEQRCSADYLRSHSTVMFNHGAGMYQLKLHAAAADALEAAIQSMAQWIAVTAQRKEPLGNAVEQLCKRFEVAALAHQSAGAFAAAARVYGRAVSWLVQHSPEAVCDAVCTGGPHAMVRPPSSTAWTGAGATAVALLLQFVDRYVRMCAGRVARDAGELRDWQPLSALMDDRPDSAVLRGWLYEAEAHFWRAYVAPSAPAAAEALRTRLELALEAYGEAAPLGYARCAAELAKLSRDAGDIRAFEDRIHAALEVTKSQPHSDSPYVLGVVADCYAWQAIAAIEAAGGSSYSPGGLRACTRLWTLVSRHAISDSGEPPDVGYLHDVVHTIQQTADLLMSRRLYAPGANVLLVAVELATACERHDRTWAPVAMECLVGLGTACLLRGDAGAAGAYFGDVATRYETGVLPPHVEVASKIAYGSFQLAQGDAAAARTTMGVAGGLARRTLDAIAGPGAGAARQKREAATPETLVLLSRAAHTYSVLALKEGALADSIDFGIHSYRILTSLLRSLAAAHRRALRAQSLRAPSGDTEDDPFSDPPPGPTGDAKSEADADAAKDDAEFVAFSGNWQLQRLLIDVLAHLADVFSVRGSTKEADYFLKRALELSAQVQAPLQEEHLRLRETSILSRKSLWDECAAALHSLRATTTAAAMPPDEVAELPAGAIAAADALVVEGDAWYRCGSYTQAQAAYAQALRLVERAGDSAAGAAIQLPPVVSSEATPRLQRILGDVALLRPRSAGPDDCNASATVAAVVRDDIEIRQRLMSVLGGPFIEAGAPTGTAAAAAEPNQAPVYRSIDQRPDHMLLRARLAFADLQRVLSADEAWGLVLKSAHMLPALRQPRAQRPRRNSAKALAKSGLEALDALLVETLEAAITVGSAHVVHEGSHLLALVRAMRTAFGLVHADVAGAAGATVASIIDDCRNVTVMREAIDSMRRRKERVPPRLTAWPADIVGGDAPASSAAPWPSRSAGGSPVRGSPMGGSPLLGGLSLPDAESPHSGSSLEHAVDGKRVTAAWDALAAESTAARRGWEPPGDSLPAILPPNWVVCGLSIDQHRDVLFVTRYAHGRQPTVLCLPMRAIAEPPADADDCGGLPDSARGPARSVFEGAYRQLRGIIAQSDETMKTGSACTTESEKRAWWDRRSLLDRRLGELLTAIEDEWLGGFRGVLEPTDAVSAADSAMHERLRTAIEQCVVGSLPRASAAKAKALELTAELCMLVYAVARRTVCRTASEEDGRGASSSAAAENDWLDVCSLLWDVYFYQGAAPPSDEDGLASFAARLADALTAVADAGPAAAAATATAGDGARPHLLLVLDKHAQQIPWECLPSIRGVSVSRVPSVALLRERIVAMRATRTRGQRPSTHTLMPLMPLSALSRPLNALRGPDLLSSLAPGSSQIGEGECSGQPQGAYVDGTRVFYVLNPEGDLHRTQANFEAYLQHGPATWRGAVGRRPMNNECEGGLSASDVFLYFGHGGAERYISRSQIRALDRCAVALLLGCSSGQLKLTGEYDALGTATDYLIGGCPALVGNLWDVGDKDIDRFAASLLRLWGLDRHSAADIAVPLDGDRAPTLPPPPAGPVSLAEAVCWARRACRMPFLTGAAPVVYGIPAYLSQ